MDILFWNMCVLMANSYILALSDNVKRSMEFNWSQGKWQALAPIGYLNIKDKNGKSQVIIDKKRAPIIKKLFEEYATGLHSATSLLKIACDMGLISKQPNYYKSSANYQKKSFIHVNTVLSMLRNPFYYGMMSIKGKILGNLSSFMQQSDNNAKNILLGILLSDCTLQNKRLTYTIRKPFSYFLTCPDHKKWNDLIIKYLKDFKSILCSIQKI